MVELKEAVLMHIYFILDAVEYICVASVFERRMTGDIK